MNRAIAYVDGFNLYYGLKEARWERFLWLDPVQLARSLLKRGQSLERTKYFTARIIGARPSDPPAVAATRNAKRRRQSAYLEALATLDGFTQFDGHYLQHTITCFECGHKIYKPEEKMTDVCIATEMLADAFTDRFDTALLVSGDSDLAPPVRAILSHFVNKKIVVAFPPRRSSSELRGAATAYFTIGRARFSKSQLPEAVIRSDGFRITRPETWR